MHYIQSPEYQATRRGFMPDGSRIGNDNNDEAFSELWAACLESILTKAPTREVQQLSVCTSLITLLGWETIIRTG